MRRGREIITVDFIVFCTMTRGRSKSTVKEGNNDSDDSLTKAFLEETIKKSTEALLTEINNLKSQLKEKDEKIDKIVIEVREAKIEIEAIKSQLQVVKAANKHLLRNQEDAEQYSRRMNIRIEGIEHAKDETVTELRDKIIASLKKTDVTVEPHHIVRCH